MYRQSSMSSDSDSSVIIPSMKSLSIDGERCLRSTNMTTNCTTSNINGTTSKSPLVRRQSTIDLVSRLTEDQRQVLKESYKKLEANSTKNGISMYLRMFQEHPETKRLFPKFRYLNDESLMCTVELRYQSVAYMHGMKSIIYALQNNDELCAIMKQISKTHKIKGVEKYHVQQMLPMLLFVLRQAEGSYSKEEVDAWTTLFDIIAELIERYKKNPNAEIT